MAVTLAAQISTPLAAVKLTVGIPAGTTTLDLKRTATATGHEAYVRGVQGRDVTGLDELVVYDYEVPLGVALVYVATAYPSYEWTQAGPITVNDSRDWLVDLARPTNTFPVAVEALPELRYDGPVGVHRVLERRDPVLTTSTLWTPNAQLSFTTANKSDRDRARAILGAGVTVLLRTPPSEGVGNLYLGVQGMSEQRPSRIAGHWYRRFAVDVVQVARPDPALFVPSPPLTYRRLLELWATYRDVLNTGLSYQELAYYEAAGGAAAPGGLPWLPDDV
jgi:hypothetical protein